MGVMEIKAKLARLASVAHQAWRDLGAKPVYPDLLAQLVAVVLLVPVVPMAMMVRLVRRAWMVSRLLVR